MILRLIGNRALTDAVLLSIVAVGTWLVSSRFELFEWLFEFSRDHEDWELDEIVLGVVSIGLAGFIYAIRRGLDLRAEIVRRNRAEADVTWMADHDMLTKLPNRHHLARMVSGIDRKSASGRSSYVVYAIDLDGFKKVNDLLGHDGGDKLLIELARRLQQAFPEDPVYRVGGDEFIVISEADDDVVPGAVARDLVERIGRPLTIAGVQVQVGACVGTARYPSDSPSMVEAMRRADVAMYAAKRSGRNSVRTFEASMDEELAQRAEVEAALNDALKAGEIVPHYQPIIDLESGRVIGFEALARWTRPDGVVTPPETFISYAEDLGLIIELSESLLYRACRDALVWPADMKLSFNISPVQLTDEVLGLRIVRILGETGLPPGRLEIEITESGLISHFEAAIRIIEDLQSAGVHISLDDFGTGYSSLSQLTRFNFDKIKIDRSFIADFQKDDKTRKIVTSMLALGQGLGIETTAEGVESEDQLSWLKDLGCESAQGFLFGKAIAADQVAGFLDGAKAAGEVRARA